MIGYCHFTLCPVLVLMVFFFLLPSLALQSYLSQVSCSGTLLSKEEPGRPLALLMFSTGNYTKLIFVGKRVFGNEAQSAKWKQAVQEIRQNSPSG